MSWLGRKAGQLLQQAAQPALQDLEHRVERRLVAVDLQLAMRLADLEDRLERQRRRAVWQGTAAAAALLVLSAVLWRWAQAPYDSGPAVAAVRPATQVPVAVAPP